MRRKWRTFVRYLIILLIIRYFYGWRPKQSIDENFVDFETCPACYGQSLCNAMLETEDANKVHFKLEGYYKWKIMKLFNVKNVYYALSNGDQVVLKKLAHDSELREFNEKLCKASKLPSDCNVSQAIKHIVSEVGGDILQVIHRHKELFEESDAIKCKHDTNVEELYSRYLTLDDGPYHLHHFLTMLAVNIEPLMMMTQHSKWFPAIIGTCGRVVVEEYVGLTLSQLGNEPWLTRADYARQLLELAFELSEGRFHFYMTDVSLDNFAVNAQGKVKVIDAENFVMVDTARSDLATSEHTNDGFGCRDCLSFSYEDLCGHKYSDHNLFAVCKGMLSKKSFSEDIRQGLLHSPPTWIIKDNPSVLSLIELCAAHPQDPNNYARPNRKEAAAALLSILSALLES